jgi:DNA-binding NarL/FixJ family response regulator
LADTSVKAIVASGYSDDPVMSDFRACGFSGVVKKPFELSELSHIQQTVTQGRA